MMDLKAIRSALAARALSADATLAATGYVPDSIVTPAIFCADVQIDYHQAMRGGTEMTVTLRVLTGRVDALSGQNLLDDYLSDTGAKSLITAIEAGRPTLGGLVDDYAVKRVDGYRYYGHAGIEYFGAEIEVMVITSG